MFSPTPSRYTYQPKQTLFYQNPSTGRLALVSFVGYLGSDRGLPVIYNRFTGLNQVVAADLLLTGHEDRPPAFWENLERYPDPFRNPELIDDLTARIALGA